MPCKFVALMAAFAPWFSTPVFQHVHGLLVDAILSPGKRTVPRPYGSWARVRTSIFRPTIVSCTGPSGPASRRVRNCSAC
jgi:hypothetical protein